MWAPRKRVPVSMRELRAAFQSGMTADDVVALKRDRNPRHTDMSFKRISECRNQIMKFEAHSQDHCVRCRLSLERRKSPLGHGYLDTRNQPVVSGYQTVILVSLRADGTHGHTGHTGHPDICVFGLSELNELQDNQSFAAMIEEMTLPESLIFHTIQFTPDHVQDSEDTFEHNLALPYRSITNQERSQITDWVLELRGHPQASKQNTRNFRAEWRHSQDLMFLLSVGHSEKEAWLLLKHKPWANFRSWSNLPSILAESNGKKVPRYWDNPHWRRKSTIAGDELVVPFATWEEGRDFLCREYPREIDLIASITEKEKENKPTLRVAQ